MSVHGRVSGRGGGEGGASVGGVVGAAWLVPPRGSCLLAGEAGEGGMGPAYSSKVLEMMACLMGCSCFNKGSQADLGRWCVLFTSISAPY